MVLGTAQWPLQPPNTNFNIPESVLGTFEKFQRYYQTKHSGRKLIWCFQLGKVEMKTTYLEGSKAGYTLQVIFKITKGFSISNGDFVTL